VKKINILFVINSLPIGGCELGLVEIVKRLDKERFRPVVICLKEEGILAEKIIKGGGKIYSCLLRSKYDLWIIPRLISLIKREKIDIVYTLLEGDAMFWGRLSAKIAGVPVIVSSIHSFKTLGGKRGIINPFNKLLLPITHKIITVGQVQKDCLIEEEGIEAGKVVLIHDGVDLTLFGGKREIIVEEYLGIPDRAPVVGIVAALHPVKAHEVFLEAAARILEVKPGVHFLIVGDGPRKEELVELSHSLGIASSIHFLGFRLDIPQITSCFDLSVLSSDSEAFPNVLLEAMAAGKPVVATNVGGCPEIVIPGETGFLAPPRDPEALSRVILTLLKDRKLAEEMGKRGRKRVERFFSVEKMVGEREQLFEDLLKEKEGGGR